MLRWVILHLYGYLHYLIPLHFLFLLVWLTVYCRSDLNFLIQCFATFPSLDCCKRSVVLFPFSTFFRMSIQIYRFNIGISVLYVTCFNFQKLWSALVMRFCTEFFLLMLLNHSTCIEVESTLDNKVLMPFLIPSIISHKRKAWKSILMRI